MVTLGLRPLSYCNLRRPPVSGFVPTRARDLSLARIVVSAGWSHSGNMMRSCLLFAVVALSTTAAFRVTPPAVPKNSNGKSHLAKLATHLAAPTPRQQCSSDFGYWCWSCNNGYCGACVRERCGLDRHDKTSSAGLPHSWHSRLPVSHGALVGFPSTISRSCLGA